MKLFKYTPTKIAVIMAFFTLMLIYGCIWTSSFPNDQGYAVRAALGVTATITAIASAIFAGIAIDQYDKRQRAARRGY